MERKLLGVYGNVLCVALLAMAKYTHHRCVYSSKKYFISYYSQHGFFLFLPLQSSLGLYVLALCSLVACFSFLQSLVHVVVVVFCRWLMVMVMVVVGGGGSVVFCRFWCSGCLLLFRFYFAIISVGVCACAFFTSHT